MTDKSSPKRPARRSKGVQLMVCASELSCGNVDKGQIPVPKERLQEAWLAHDLTAHCRLSVTSCLGMCNVSNSGCLNTPQGRIWLGHLRQEHYEALILWGQAVAEARQVGGGLPELPEVLQVATVDRTALPASRYTLGGV